MYFLTLSYISFKKYLKVYFCFISHVFVFVFCLYMCLCSICVPDAHGREKRVSDVIKLELQVIVSHYVNACSPRSCGKIASDLNH